LTNIGASNGLLRQYFPKGSDLRVHSFEEPDNSVATVASCIGITLGLLDDWMSGQDGEAPASVRQRATLQAGHWTGERAATDILVLARKGRAFRSLDKLLIRQGGPPSPRRLRARAGRRHRRLGTAQPHPTRRNDRDPYPLIKR